MITMDELQYNTADPTENQRVGAFMLGAGGTPLTSTTVGSDEALDVNVVQQVGALVPNTALKTQDVDVTTTAAKLITASLTSRKRLTVQNLGAKPIYVGFDNTVTATNGTKIPKHSSWSEDLGPAIEPWAIAGAGTVDVRVLEAA